MVTTRAKQRAQEYPTELPQKRPKTKMNIQEFKGASVRDEKVFGLFKRSVYLQDLYDKEALIKAGTMEWAPPFDKRDIQKTMISFRVLVKRWVSEFVASEPQDVDCLSQTQKQTIISSLKGHCVQEDWDVLMGRLSDLHRDLILEVFLEMLLLKEIFAKFFEAPFWYLDGKMNSADEQGDDTFGARLQHLYERFLETNPLSAALWRSETFRLANSVKMEQAPNTKLGSYHQERRNSFLGKLVDDTLSIQPIQWMLRKLSTKEEESKRRKELYELYQVAADRSSSQANMRGHFEFHGLDCLPEVFHLASNMIEPHTLHFLQEGSTRLDGRRVLMVVYPGITRKWIDESAIWGHEISSKAYVVVEDPEDPKGGEELKGKDKDELSR